MTDTQRAAAKRMHDNARRNLIERGGLSRTGTLKRTGVLAKVSDKQIKRYRDYYRKKRAHLLKFPDCARCGRQAHDVHHIGGRSGERLTDETLFCSLCRGCHDWAESNWNAAVAEGFMISKHQVRK